MPPVISEVVLLGKYKSDRRHCQESWLVKAVGTIAKLETPSQGFIVAKGLL